jgi:hypothetical protein
MTDRELLQMALDALEESKKHITDQRRDKTIEALRAALANEFNPDWNQVEALQESLREHMAEIQRLRAALAQPEPEPVAYTTGHCENHKQKGGCQLHNLQCGWPNCDRKLTTLPQREENHDGEKFVYRAITRSGEIAHFGVYSAAKAWAKSGTVEEVPIRTFKVVQKPCSSCESLARTVMLDQTYHENIIAQREWKGLTDEEILQEADKRHARINNNIGNDLLLISFYRAIESKLKEKNSV